jgi:hypothetical protein
VLGLNYALICQINFIKDLIGKKLSLGANLGFIEKIRILEDQT